MGKKAGKSKSGIKVKKAKPVTDGLLPNEMSRPQMLGHIVRLQAELEKEKEERNYYMLEREKVYQLWNLLLEQIQMEKEKAALFDAHMQDVAMDKEGEDSLYNQKLRFLKQEQTRKLGQVRLLHLTKMKHIQDDAWEVQMVMREALMGKKKEIRKAQMAFFQIIRGLYWQHAKEISDLRKEFALEIRRLETMFDRRLFENSDKKDEEQAIQVALLADTKETQVHKLVDSHRYQTKELQKFFRDLIRHNLTLIYGMKDAAKKQKTYELRARKDYEGFKEKYDKYISSAVKWKEDMERWEIEHTDDVLEELLKDLQDSNEEVKRHRHSLRMLECSNETLRQQIIIAEKEKASLKKEFSLSVVDVQRRTSMNRFVSQIRKGAAKRDADLFATLADNVERNSEDGLDYFTELITSKDQEKAEIKMDIIEHATEHKNTEESYKEAFIKNEINLADIGFPILGTGVQARRPEEDLLGQSDMSRSSKLMSKRHKSVTRNDVKRSIIKPGLLRSKTSTISVSIKTIRSDSPHSPDFHSPRSPHSPAY